MMKGSSKIFTRKGSTSSARRGPPKFRRNTSVAGLWSRAALGLEVHETSGSMTAAPEAKRRVAITAIGLPASLSAVSVQAALLPKRPS